MGSNPNEEVWLTAAQCAGRIGITVRALRLYEHAGLIRPRRTGKNWRLYGAHELSRLNEVIALKRLGLSLQDIARLLAGQETDLDRMLAVQDLALQDQISRTRASLALIATLRTKIASGEVLSVDDLVGLAKDIGMTDASSDAVAWRRYEQARPRTERKIDLSLYDDYAGAYLLDRLGYVVVRKDDRLFARLTGQPELEIYPEDVDRFFYKTVQAQIRFDRDEGGTVSGLTLHQDGHEQAAPRVDMGVVTDLEQTLAERVRHGRPVENGETLLQRVIEQHQRGEPDYEQMTPPLAAIAREQFPMIRSELERLGPLRTMSFKGVTAAGWDVYDIGFDEGRHEWSFVLASDGRFSGIFFQPSL